MERHPLDGLLDSYQVHYFTWVEDVGNWRLSKDDEGLPLTQETLVDAASARLMLRCLAAS